MELIQIFGRNLRKRRNAMNLSQEQFAELCGLHRTYISDIECCTRNISLETVQRIATALDIEAYKMFMEEG